MKYRPWIFVPGPMAPEVPILLPDNEGRYLVLFTQAGFGWNHPLRQSWRKQDKPLSTDVLRVLYGVTLLILIVAVGMSTFVAGPHSQHYWDWHPSTEVIINKLVGLSMFSVLSLLMSVMLFVSTGFKPVLKRAGEILGMSISPSLPQENLRWQASFALCTLARAWRLAEREVAEKPHEDARYVARAQAKSAFVVAHKSLLELGLVEKKWDKYFEGI